MRCYACNEELSDYESTRKSKTTGEYLDLCNICFSTIEDIFIEIEEEIEEKEQEERQLDLQRELVKERLWFHE